MRFSPCSHITTYPSPSVIFKNLFQPHDARKGHQLNGTFAVSRRGGGGCRAGVGPLWPPPVPLHDRLPILCHTPPPRETPNCLPLLFLLIRVMGQAKGEFGRKLRRLKAR